MKIIIIGSGMIGMMIIHHITVDYLIVESVEQIDQHSEKKLIMKEFITQPYIMEDDEVILKRCEPQKEQCPTDIVVPTRIIPSWYHALWTNPP